MKIWTTRSCPISFCMCLTPMYVSCDTEFGGGMTSFESTVTVLVTNLHTHPSNSDRFCGLERSCENLNHTELSYILLHVSCTYVCELRYQVWWWYDQFRVHSDRPCDQSTYLCENVKVTGPPPILMWLVTYRNFSRNIWFKIHGFPFVNMLYKVIYVLLKPYDHIREIARNI